MPPRGYRDLQIKEFAFESLAEVCAELKTSTWTECILKLIEIYRKAKQLGIA